MLQSLLVKILEKNFQLNSELVKEIANFLSNYKNSTYIYPSVLKLRFKLDNKIIYEILNQLEKEKILKSYYEIVCYKCNKSLKIVERFSELEDNALCEDCDFDMATLDNVKLIYKVIQ